VRVNQASRIGQFSYLRALSFIIFPVLMTLFCWSQQPSESTIIQVQADQLEGPMPPVWNYFGYDEPNYTYAPNGRKLLGELAALGRGPVYVRVHNLLTTGDGAGSLKWGSTNVYSEDASGQAVYSWTILDKIFDTFRESGVKPLVEIGFMPKALSTHPEPYRHDFPRTPVGEIYTGWAYPPKDYKKWSDLVFHFVDHLRRRYGDAEVNTWLWEVWNEPDIGYWKGTREEYFKLYDFSVEAVLRALPDARIGGPETTGPGNTKAADFLQSFLDHCAHQQNYANGKTGSRLNFISFHPKGSPTWQSDHVQMGINRQLTAMEQGFKIVRSFPEWRRTPVILGESDPEGCAACSAQENPQNLYRNGPLYGAYTVEVLNNILQLARREDVNFLGAVTWAFEFEDQPLFAGFREFATNGVDKPVLNAFRMLGLLDNAQLKASSSGALASQEIVRTGVRGHPDINVIATRRDGNKDKDKNNDKNGEIEILVWNYHDDDVPSPAAPIDLVVNGLPATAKRVLVEHFRVDSNHSNAFTAWKAMGSPQSVSASQFELLESAGQLQLLNSPAWTGIHEGTLRLQFMLPRQGISLLRLAW
jgi:xylan 1,4-beta-xylosidase